MRETVNSDIRTTLTDSARSVVRRILVAPATVPLRTQALVGVTVYAVLFIGLVAFGISGTSSGIMYGDFFTGVDPRRIAGVPRAIRSDEYFVAAPLLISQVQQGLPRFSDIVPGHVDLSVLWDLPYRDWSTLLRPQNWGFFFLPLDNAFSFKWWLPAVCMGAACYLLLTTLWRRPLASLAVSGAFILSPFFQWWYGAGSFWPPTFGVVIVLVTIWILRAEKAWVRWCLGALAAYAALVAIVALYPAFLIPCVLAGGAGAIGWLISGVPQLPWSVRLRRFAPVVAGAGVAVLVLAAYLLTRRDALETITATVYPGQRSWPTGQYEQLSAPSAFAGIFGQGLGAGDVSGFAPNPSEGSSFLLIGLYLVPSAVWLVYDRWHRSRRVDGVLVGLLACLAVFFAFIYVPGWDLGAKALLLSMTTTSRIIIGFGLLSFLLLAVVVHRLLERKAPPPPWTVLAAIALAGMNHAAVFLYLHRHAPVVLGFVSWWPVLVALLVGAVGLLARGRVTAPALMFVVVAVAVGGWVNPIYRGLLDLRTTDIAQAVVATEEAAPGAWVGMGSTSSIAMLRETAVESFSGTQGYPTEQMWKLIDPTGAYENFWNRYAHVLWTVDPAAPLYALPAADTVVIKFDSCGQFAQANVAHVLTQEPLDQPCVRLRSSLTEPTSTYRIYDVVPATP
ncbi:MAG: DUF7657 domain-containing protein [Cellulomonas sp.]